MLQLLATAGGLQEYADKEKIVILRRENGGRSRLQVQLQGGDPAEEPGTEHRAEARRHRCRSVTWGRASSSSARWCSARPVLPSAQAAPATGRFAGCSAQPTPRRRGQTLGVDWSVLGAYDDNLLADTTGGGSISPVIASGIYGGANGGLTYGALGEHMSFGANAALRRPVLSGRPCS